MIKIILYIITITLTITPLISSNIILEDNITNDKKISNALKILLADNRDTKVDVIISLYSPPSREDIRIIEEHGGVVFQRWSNLIYAIHAKLPADEIYKYSKYKNIKFIEKNSNISFCLDYSTRQIRARPVVWNTYGYQGNESQTIAILDTGIDDSHVDLENKIVEWMDFNGNYTQPIDKNGHGTHCAGIAAGRGVLNSKNYTTTLNDYSYFYHDIGEYRHTTFVTANISGNLTVKLRWDDDYTDGIGNASIWIDINHNDRLDPGEYLNGTSPLNFSINITPGRYKVGVTAIDYDAWLEDFYCQIDPPVIMPNDGYGVITGAAPNCRLAGIKILDDNGNGNVDDIIDALNWLADNARNYSIIVASMSIGLPQGEVNTVLDNAVNNLVSKGVVCVVAAGNSQGSYYVASPGTAAKAITVGAVDDENALTDYSSIGDPNRNPIKPDVLAPGGSWYTGDEIISIDSNDADDTGEIDADFYPNDYRQMLGTSMACPHVAGLAALIIDALGKWNYTEEEALKVKQLILMTSYEIENAETTSYTPPFNHGEKDNREGYGLVAADAAIEATTMTFTPTNLSLGSNIFDKKVWARKINLTQGKTYNFTLTVPPTGDFDLYLYDYNPNANGEPILLGYSCNSGSNNESINFTPIENKTCYILVKHRSGYGEANIDLECKPLCNFSYTPNPPTDLDTIYFIDTSNDPDIVAWYWDFGDGNISYEQNPMHKYADDGIYNVTLQVVDRYCGINSSSKEIVVLNNPPIADFNYTPLHPTTQDIIYCNDNSYDLDGYIINWTWDFGDGNISYQQNPTHRYNNNGIYNLTLSIKDDDNTINEITKQIMINAIPIINFTYYPTTPMINKKIYFNDTSYDIDGYIVSWHWDFGDGNTSNERNPTHIYVNNGSYTIIFTITDNDGSTNTTSKPITVYIGPNTNFSWQPQYPSVNETVHFVDLSTDPDGTIISWNWSFGDENNSNTKNATHIYIIPGVYNVTLNITDNNGVYNIFSKKIIINDPPRANFTYSPIHPKTFDIIVFNDTSQDRYGRIINWTWDFGDGNISYGINVTHIYKDDNIYNITLTVIDNCTAKSNYTRSIIVENIIPHVNFTYVPSNPVDLDKIYFNDTSYDIDGYIVSWYWDFGDGNVSTDRNTTHVYADNGIYNVTLTVIDDDGSSNTTYKWINVSNIPPISNYTYTPLIPLLNKTIFFNETSQDLDGYIANYTWIFDDGTIEYSRNTTHVFKDFKNHNVTLIVRDNDNRSNSIDKTIILRDYIIRNQTNMSINTSENIYFYDINVNVTLINSTTIIISHYSDNPIGIRIPEVTPLNFFYNLTIEDEGNINWPIDIAIYYNLEELNNSGIEERQLVGIYYWNGTGWHLYNNTGVNTEDILIDSDYYAGYSWTKVWHLTFLTIGADIEPPSKITGLKVEDGKDGKLDLSWNSASDNIGIAYYNIYRDGILIANVTSTTYRDTSLNNGYTYTYRVSAVDIAGNEGNLSDPASGKPTVSNHNNGGSSSGGTISYKLMINNPPVASADIPSNGVVNESINFDASSSYDPDKGDNIIFYSWDFGDGTIGLGMNITHIYSNPGIYNVTLIVRDTHNTEGSYSTTIIIYSSNNPPSKPVINGPTAGHRNTSCNYTFKSTDPDNDNIQYTIDWGDGTNYTTGFIENNTSIIITHSWSKPGKYTIYARAFDNKTISIATVYIVYIDAVKVGNIGYLIDVDSDGIYDLFHNETSNDETSIKYKNGWYLIDENGDDKWEYNYNPNNNSDKLIKYKNIDIKTKDKLPGFEIIEMVIIVLSFFIFRRQFRKQF